MVKTEKPLVSVIIPVYNRPKMVKRAISSVLNQTFKNLELIIADDGSTDETKAVINSFLSDLRVKILLLEHCGFPGLVRNRAADLAEGKWLAFLDSDDIWLEDKLEVQLRYLDKHKEFLFIHSLEKWIRNRIEVSQIHRKHKKEGDLFEISLGKCEIGPSTVMIDKDLFLSVHGFREDLEICEDYELWLKLTSENPVGYIDQILVIKNGGHENQLSKKYGYIENFKIEALRGLVDKYYFTNEKMVPARKELAKKCRIYSKGCRKRGKEIEADNYEELYISYSVDDVLIEE